MDAVGKEMVELLEGKNIIVTGTSRGIGKSMIDCFARKGANLFACMRTVTSEKEEELRFISELRGVNIIPVELDLRDETQQKDAVRFIKKNCIRIDGLVCNAGVAHNGMLQTTSIDKMREIMETNFFAQMRLIQLVSRAMIPHQAGSIVAIGSTGGLMPRAGFIAYGSSKAALMWAMSSLAQELGPFGIRVNTVAPGLTDTDMLQVRSKESIEEAVSMTAERRLGKPEEIAEAVAFLLSDSASFINGQTLRVDGGRS